VPRTSVLSVRIRVFERQSAVCVLSLWHVTQYFVTTAAWARTPLSM
jgi:hypothetical protein